MQCLKGYLCFGNWKSGRVVWLWTHNSGQGSSFLETTYTELTCCCYECNNMQGQEDIAHTSFPADVPPWTCSSRGIPIYHHHIFFVNTYVWWEDSHNFQSIFQCNNVGKHVQPTQHVLFPKPQNLNMWYRVQSHSQLHSELEGCVVAADCFSETSSLEICKTCECHEVVRLGRDCLDITTH